MRKYISKLVLKQKRNISKGERCFKSELKDQLPRYHLRFSIFDYGILQKGYQKFAGRSFHPHQDKAIIKCKHVLPHVYFR